MQECRQTNAYPRLSQSKSKHVVGKTEVNFLDPSEIGVLGLTWKVTLQSRCNLKNLRSIITFFLITFVHLLVKNLKLFNKELDIIVKFSSFFFFGRSSVPVCKKG